MATIPAQQAVAEFHAEIGQHAHHGGHDMYIFHRNWHQQNTDPIPPSMRDRDWGTNLAYGANFLQMHHEMVKAADNEQKLHMQHQSLVSWYRAKNYDVPAEWNPLAEIPEILAYDPDVNVYPAEIRNAVVAAADRQGITPAAYLRRRANRPNFNLPKFFMREGVAPGEAGERYTGARKLADFQNVNQLGCCIVFPHNAWHGAIGGAMRSTWTAIADPIFYFGVHWHIDKVFDEYKQIQDALDSFRFDKESLRARDALESEDLPRTEEFTREEREQREADITLSKSLKTLSPL